MKCLCTTKCYLPDSTGQPRVFSPGEVAEFKKCPMHFETMEPLIHEVNFAVDSADVLSEAKWSFNEAKAAVKELFNAELKTGKKTDLITQILYTRDNYIAPDITGNEAK